MGKYLFIESRDPFESNEVAPYYDLSADLARQGNEVTLFLVQNGVLPARSSIHSDLLARITRSGVEILADEFSLRERGIPADGLIPGIKPSPLDVVVDHLADDRKVLWH